MGGGELILVAVVALLVLGPKKLPQVATTLGRWIAQIQKGFEEVKTSVNKSLKEDEIKEVTKFSAPISSKTTTPGKKESDLKNSSSQAKNEQENKS